MISLTTLLEGLVAKSGSDLHLVVGEPPVYRVDGRLQRQGEAPLDRDGMEALLSPYLNHAEATALEHKQDVEKTLREGMHRFRLHAFRERGNLAACVRAVPNRVPSLQELGLGADAYPIFQEIIKARRGLVLVVGPTGSGKMTTAAALVEEINRTMPARILTIENPVEYEFEPKEGIITQQTIGEDVTTFPEALRAALYSDPDVLLVSELREQEAFQMTLTLAETGHLVFTTMHVHSASAAVQRLIEMWPESQQTVIRRLLSQYLVAVISQRLLPRADRPGRVPVQEILTASPRVRQMIADGRTDLTAAIEAGRDVGMQTMDDNLIRLVEVGTISPETAWLHLENKERLPRPVPAPRNSIQEVR